MLREGGLPPLPRRLASRFARLMTRALADDEIDPAEETALASALAAAKQSFTARK
jgi:hypothetical protein